MRSLPRLSFAFPLRLLGANRPVPKVNIAGMPHYAFITPVRANADQNRGPRGAGALTIPERPSPGYAAVRCAGAWVDAIGAVRSRYLEQVILARVSRPLHRDGAQGSRAIDREVTGDVMAAAAYMRGHQEIKRGRAPPNFFGMSRGEGNIPCRRIAVCSGPPADTFSF